MDKQELINKLNSQTSEIIEVIVDIANNLTDCIYHNESILVFAEEEPSNSDLIKYSKHWCTCDSEQLLEVLNPNNDLWLNHFYVCDVKSVTPFKSDFLTDDKTQELADKFTNILMSEVYGERFTKLESLSEGDTLNDEWERLNSRFYEVIKDS